jgi:hypothetical protein
MKIKIDRPEVFAYNSGRETALRLQFLHGPRTENHRTANLGRQARRDRRAIGNQTGPRVRFDCEDLPQDGIEQHGPANEVGVGERHRRILASGAARGFAGDRTEGAAHENADQYAPKHADEDGEALAELKAAQR